MLRTTETTLSSASGRDKAMALAKPAAEEISGYLGVGSLELLGGFFVLDGISGFLAFIEVYSKSSAWIILVAAPLLVVSYVAGLVTCLSVEAAVNLARQPILTPEIFARVAAAKNDLLSQRFADAERHARLLYGCTFAFALLAAGSLLEVSMMGEFGFVGFIGLALGLLIASACPLLARHVQRDLLRSVEAVEATQPCKSGGRTY